MKKIELKNEITASELMKILENDAEGEAEFEIGDLTVNASIQEVRAYKNNSKYIIFTISAYRDRELVLYKTSNYITDLLEVLNNPNKFGIYDYGHCVCDEQNNVIKCFGLNTGTWRKANNYADKNGLNYRFTMDGEVYLNQDDYNLQKGKQLLKNLTSEEVRGFNLLKSAIKNLKDGYMLSIITSDNTEYIFQKGADVLEKALNRIVECTECNPKPMKKKYIVIRLATSTQYHEYTTGDGEDPNDYHYEEGVNNYLFDYIRSLALDDIKEADVIPFDINYFAKKSN